MANRFFQQFQGSLQKKVVTLFAKVTFDGSGVATVVTSEQILVGSNPTTINPSSGFVGGTITSTGTPKVYAFALQDPYVRLLSAHAVTDGVASGTAKVALGCGVLVDSVNSQNAPSLSIGFQSLDVGSGTIAFGTTLTDCTVLLRLDLSNTTAP